MNKTEFNYTFYVVVSLPFYILIYLGLVSFYPKLNYFSVYQYSTYSSVHPINIIPSQQLAPFFIITGIIGVFGLVYRHFLKKGVKK